MSSVRPVLKPQIPKIVTAWDTATGRSIYRCGKAQWSQNRNDAEILAGDQAKTALAEAKAEQILANDPYLMQVTADGRIDGRETLRETLRACGPSIHPHLGRQAGNP